MQIRGQIFLIMNRKCYLCIENKKRTPNSALITKSYDKSVWCNFSVHCLKEIQNIVCFVCVPHSTQRRPVKIALSGWGFFLTHLRIY